ncbi:MAG: hypothetical protein HYZ11_00015 [Candidatus Tectomicrobia bacterium]|uniref:Outer membrane beta-barrel protein n=1 Tax=Tectimicrobiota bacterium TaxID=2528274 RepID=A0A932HV01_UNCTE|nr:hypothetical protein [Candidatus Tectomicrobia bacterium]
MKPLPAVRKTLAALALLAALGAALPAAGAPAGGEDPLWMGRGAMEKEWGKVLRLSGEIGPAAYRYEEHFGATSSRFESEGVSWTLLGELELLPPLGVGAALEVTRIGRDIETWSNLPAGTVIGTQVDQTNDTQVDVGMLDIYASLAVVRAASLELEFLAGWHFLRHRFERSNFAFQVSGFTIHSILGPVSEDVSADGPSLGARLTAKYNGFVLGGGLQWAYLPNLRAENSLLGNIESEGNSLRWRLGLGYRAREWLELGLSYRGTYIEVEEGRSVNAVLPNNRTYINSIFFQAEIRF